MLPNAQFPIRKAVYVIQSRLICTSTFGHSKTVLSWSLKQTIALLSSTQMSKIFKCYFKVGQQGIRTLLRSKFNNQVVSFTSPVVLHSINLHKTGFNNEKIRILGISNAEDIFINLNRNLSYTYMNMTHFTMTFIIDSGIRYIELRRYKGNDFDVDLALAFN